MKNDNPRLQADDLEITDDIRQKIMEAVDAYEERLNSDPSLADVRLTDEMRADMMWRIQKEDERIARERAMDAALSKEAADGGAGEEASGMSEADAGAEAAAQELAGGLPPLSAEDRRALEIGRKAMRIGRHRRALRVGLVAAALAAVLVGMSMSSSAGRAWWVNMWDYLMGQEMGYRTENTGELRAYYTKMQEIYADILEKTGIHSVQFMYLPEGLKFKEYSVDEIIKTAKLFYQYQDTILTVNMKKDNENTVRTSVFDGKILETETISVAAPLITANVMEIEAPENEKDYVAEILYDDCLYEIYGVLPHMEFIKMVEKISFY